jgi:hypothetical protein
MDTVLSGFPSRLFHHNFCNLTSHGAGSSWDHNIVHDWDGPVIALTISLYVYSLFPSNTKLIALTKHPLLNRFDLCQPNHLSDVVGKFSHEVTYGERYVSSGIYTEQGYLDGW